MGCAAAGEPLSTSCQDSCSSVPAGCQDLAWVCTCPARVAVCRAAGQGVAGVSIGVATYISIGSAASPSTGFPGLGDMEGAGPPSAGEGEWASGPWCCRGSTWSWEEALGAADAAEMSLPLSQPVGSCLSQRLFYFWQPHYEVPIRPLPRAMASAGARSLSGGCGEQEGPHSRPLWEGTTGHPTDPTVPKLL